MSGLGLRLDAALEEDELRLSGVQFANDRFDSVRGRIARRRAARAAGMGGASALGIGAVAVGAWQVPWVGLVYGTSDAQAPVVCTTTTPEAEGPPAPLTSPEGAPLAVVDTATWTPFFVGQKGTTVHAWTHDGVPVPLEPRADGSATLTLPSGATALLVPGAIEGEFEVSDFDDKIVMVLPAQDYIDAAGTPNEPEPGTAATDLAVTGTDGIDGSRTWTVIRLSDGTPLVSVTRQADGATVVGYLSAGASLVPSEAGDILVALEDGRTLSVAVAGEALSLLYLGKEEGGTETSVTCVTVTPEPSESPSASPSDAVGALPTLSPDPRATASEVSSPFQCDYVFAGTEGSTGVVTVGDTTWLSSQEGVDTIRSFYADPDSVSVNASGDDVPITKVHFDPDWHGLELGGATGPYDPAIMGGGDGADSVSEGAMYVLAANDVVVATYDGAAPNHEQYIDRDEILGLDLIAVNLRDGMTLCDGVDEGVLDDAEVVAVAGVSVSEWLGPVDGPYYGWRFIGEPGDS